MTGRKNLDAWGRRGKPGYVRLFSEPVEGRTLIRCQWREDGRIRTESWEHTRKGVATARAYAEGTHERLTAAPVAKAEAPITLRELWGKYLTSRRDTWKPKTVITTTGRWTKFELFAGKQTHAQSITRETMDQFKRALIENKHAPNQVANHIATVRAVFRWAVEYDVLASSKVPLYVTKLGRAFRASGPVMAEYSAAEAKRIMAQMDPRDSRRWRAWAATVFFAYCGPRQNAALHLEWEHVDFTLGRIFYAPEMDKMGKARWQPMPSPVSDAFQVALGWALREGYTGRFVFYAPSDKRQTRDEPWTYSAYNYALRQAEDRAGVPHVKHRAAHGFRRMVAGNVYEITGDAKAASDWIGDSSVKVVDKHYLLTRPEVMDDVAKRLGETE